MSACEPWSGACYVWLVWTWAPLRVFSRSRCAVLVLGMTSAFQFVLGVA